MSDDRTFTVEADGTKHVIEGKPITVVCHPGGVKTRVLDDDVQEINPADTLAMADKLAAAPDFWAELRANPDMQRAWACVWGETPMPVDLAEAPTDMRHVAGLIICTLWALGRKKRPFWRLPETYLHPRQQTGLADLLLLFTKGAE